MIILIPLIAILYIIGIVYFVGGGSLTRQRCYMCQQETYVSHAVEVEGAGFSPCDGRIEWTCSKEGVK